MEGRPNNKDRITKTGDFFKETTEKLENSKISNIKCKRSHKKAKQQEKIKPLGLKQEDNMWLEAKNIQFK